MNIAAVIGSGMWLIVRQVHGKKERNVNRYHVAQKSGISDLFRDFRVFNCTVMSATSSWVSPPTRTELIENLVSGVGTH